MKESALFDYAFFCQATSVRNFRTLKIAVLQNIHTIYSEYEKHLESSYHSLLSQ